MGSAEVSKQNNLYRNQCFYTKTKTGHRIVAGLIDLFLIYLTDLIMFIPLILVLCFASETNSMGKLCTIAFLGVFTGLICSIVSLGYRAFIPAYNHNQTVGMRLMRMKYLDENGNELSRKRLYYRAISVIFLVITTVGLYYIIEIVTLSFSSNKNDIADQISKTIIVDIESND